MQQRQSDCPGCDAGVVLFLPNRYWVQKRGNGWYCNEEWCLQTAARPATKQQLGNVRWVAAPSVSEHPSVDRTWLMQIYCEANHFFPSGVNTHELHSSGRNTTTWKIHQNHRKSDHDMSNATFLILIWQFPSAIVMAPWPYLRRDLFELCQLGSGSLHFHLLWHHQWAH